MITRRLKTATLCVAALALSVAPAEAQQVPGLGDTLQGKLEQLSETHWQLTDKVEITQRDVKLLAETVDYFTDTKQLLASGNVVFAQGNQRLSADRIEFNTETRTGTFYNARGIMGLGVTAELSLFGTQEPDVYFYGQTIEKIGPERYRITKGGFTTCVQPTPRWEIVSSTAILNLDHYAILRNSLLRVKGMPVLYLPVFYYPINKEDRATGFLIPQYGVSTIRGQTIGNAFFWAVNRSHDVTFMHDWFSRTGQGSGAEYRYVLSPASSGTARTYFLNEHEAIYQSPDGKKTIVPGRRSYEIRGAGNQAVGAGLRASGRVDYFSDITVQQIYHTNIYESSRRSRSFAGALIGTWGAHNVTGSYERSETFSGTTSSTLSGSAPRLNFSRGERPIAGSPVYVAVTGEYSTLVRESRSGATAVETGLGRLDVLPLIRLPFTRWPFLTANTSVTWRNTFWTESKNALGVQIPDAVSRRYFDVQSQITGPVFSKIWEPRSPGYAERYKHSIEPVFTIQRLTAIDQFARIVQLDSVDSIVGSMTRYTYGLNNRIFAKRLEGTATMSTAREIMTVSVNQTYYTDDRAAKYDQFYRTTSSTEPPSHFSPISITARVAPTLESSGNFRAEFDARHGAFRSFGADATILLQDRLQSTVGWSQRRFIKDLPGFNVRGQLEHFLNQSTLVRTPTNRVGVLYSFNYDARLSSFLQQRIMGYYNAQCCGFSVEYQTFDFKRLGTLAPVTQDRRFNFSFTLAGIGSFSNFFGALGGAPR